MEFLHCEGELGKANTSHRSYGNEDIKSSSPAKFAFALAGGVLTILSSLASALLGSFIIWVFLAASSEYPNYPPDYWVLFLGILGFLGFALGLTSGILALLRRKFTLAVIGPSLIIIEFLVTTLDWLALGMDRSMAIPLFMPTVLAFLGLIFVAIAKQEFH